MTLWKRARTVLPSFDPIDAVALLSVAVLATGVAMVFLPAAFIVVGGLGLMYAVAVSRHETPEGES